MKSFNFANNYLTLLYMSLQEIVDNSRTDKNTVHSYLPLYQKLLINKKETAKNLESEKKKETAVRRARSAFLLYIF